MATSTCVEHAPWVLSALRSAARQVSAADRSGPDASPAWCAPTPLYHTAHVISAKCVRCQRAALVRLRFIREAITATRAASRGGGGGGMLRADEGVL